MVVSGIRARIVRAGIVANILLLAVFSVGNPLRWLDLLRELRKKSRTIQGLP
jgi:hypothetical protein